MRSSAVSSVFQFQSAAINGPPRRLRRAATYGFTSNQLRLMERPTNRPILSAQCFNSNQLRLMEAATLTAGAMYYVFQFQSAAINGGGEGLLF